MLGDWDRRDPINVCIFPDVFAISQASIPLTTLPMLCLPRHRTEGMSDVGAAGVALFGALDSG
jgi:hypothetical protein